MPEANNTSSALAIMNTNELSGLIDDLLEQYLSLLDGYTTLRVELSKAQISIQQHLARANFHADRGVRYGADCYDSRMQASRVCSVTLTPESTTISNPVSVVYTVSAIGRANKNASPTSPTSTSSHSSEKEEINDITTKIEGETLPMGETSPIGEKEDSQDKIPNPIRMFGFTTPRELKVAQMESVTTIEDILPQLASVDSQMKALEIAIRRARKYRAKAEAYKSDDIPT